MLELMKRTSLIERPPVYNNNNNNNNNTQSQQCVNLRKKGDNVNKPNLNLNNLIRPKSLLCSTTDYDDTYYTSHNQSNTWKFHKPKPPPRPYSLTR